MGTNVDQTMPALFSTPVSSSSDTVIPLAQLGAGSDGVALLATRGGRLVELIHPTFGPESPRWALLEQRVRAIGAIGSSGSGGVRAVLAIETDPPTLVLEGDSSPPFAELIERGLEPARATQIVLELARAIAAAHHVGIAHGKLSPWTVQIGTNDRVRFELTALDTKPIVHDWIAYCRAPEAGEGFAEAAADVFALGATLELATRGKDLAPALRELIRDAMALEPEARLSSVALVQRLAALAKPPGAGPITLDEVAVPAGPLRPSIGLMIGRFELAKQLGVGAMGEVWQARDTTGGPDVAIKLLKPEIAADAELLRRFRKEARVLAKVGSPYIANMIDLNEDRGLHYLVLELVTGGSVEVARRRLERLPESLALAIVADACRALSEPHRLGIVHRDLKPDNMMFVRPGLELEAAPAGQVIKLGDFGIARIVEGHATAQGRGGATREGTVLGTPEYMAPEQCQGAVVSPATDVYALGCCLYSLIAGHPPFVTVEDNAMAVILQHMKAPPPELAREVPETSPPVAELVARCLAKDPKARPADATELLAVIDRLCNGTTALITAHPAPPVFRETRIQTYRFEWELRSSPEALWPFVSNTEKMNRAAGLPPVRYEMSSVSSGMTNTTGQQRVGGLNMVWKEMPYEWIEGNRHTVLRVFDRGVLRWYVSEVILERQPGGGTKLVNTVRMEPRGFLARMVSKWQIGVRYKGKLDTIYRRLDQILHASPRPEIDPIDPDVTITAAGRERVAQLAKQLGTQVEDSAALALASYLLHASDQDVARIRPLELAAKFGTSDDAMIEACLRATKLGGLAMVWDVICPSCRIASNVVDTLQKIEEHGRCKACNIGYEVDFSRAIELAFRASPEIREVETRTYCVGGPAHFPHVVAQIRLQPHERFALPLSLVPGFYQLRSPQLARAHDFRVASSGGVRRADVDLGSAAELPVLTAGDQLLTLVNPERREIVIRVERAGDRAFALTAARVMACAPFRELFPDQQLAPGRLMAVTQATLLVAQLDNASQLFRELGDHEAFPVAARFFELVGEAAKEYGGTLLKTFGGLAIAAFERPAPALDAALGIQAALDRHRLTSGLAVRVVVHRGPMMALTQGGRLDYFGHNVELALAAVDATPPGVVALTSNVYREPAVAERLQTTPDQQGMHDLERVGWVLHVGGRRGKLMATGAMDTAKTIVQ